MVTGIVEQIIAAADLPQPFLWEPDHPAYQDGHLTLTREDYQRVLDHFGIEQPLSRCLWGIPVRLI